MNTVYYYDEKVTEETIQDIQADYEELPIETIRQLIECIGTGEDFSVADFPDNLQADIEDFIQYVNAKPLIEPQPSAPVTEGDTPDPEALFSAAVVAPLGGKFLLGSDGAVEINTQAPPSVEEAHDTFLDFYNMTRLTDVAKDKASWMLGEYIVACENHFGENFNPSQVIDITEKAYNTLYQAARIVRMFAPDDRAKLSYSHHREVGMTTKLEQPDRKAILQKAEDLDLSTRDTRSLCSLAKENGPEILDRITTSDDIKAIKDETEDKKEVFVYEAKPDLWKKTTRKATEEPPAGLTVINLTRMKLLTGEVELDICTE